MTFAWRSTFLLSLVLSATVQAQVQAPVPSVVRLRADTVTLTAVDARTRPATREVTRQQVADAPLPIQPSKGDDGTVTVLFEGKAYKVAGIDVVTNELRTARTCIDKNGPKVGGTRGMNEPVACK